MFTLFWQERQDEASDYKSYCISDDLDTVFKVYWLLKDTKLKYNARLSYNGQDYKSCANASWFNELIN